MKRFFLLATFVCAALFSSCEGYDDSELVNRLNDFENRLKKLEELCSQMNTDITSLRTIVTAIQKNDQISTVAPISKDGKEIGYSIVFTSGKSITIYHGTDGQNGQNGSDGQNGQDGADGYTPVIGVKMDADGIYYWTVDGEWLTDENGNKIQASPSEADSGADGENGKDGKDGVTPQLKIENEYWYVSYDNGQTWTKLGKATGEQGPQGPQGSTGQNGADGYTPVIGVKMDADGIYYWTVDGEWLTDENGNKIQASPSEADSGADGENGKDGKDGVTPQLKIENEYWFVSYDNGQTWTKLGKATGAQGDSFFQSVTQDSNNVYFKLADGTTITIPKASGAQSIALTYIPRYSDGKATVLYSSKSDSYVELDFEVSPASAAANWRDAATVKAVYTETRAGVQMVDMAIQSWTVDSDAGTITVKASGANLSDAFFAGTQEASARLAIDDDNLNLLSDYIPMVAKNTNAQPDPEPLESITLSTPIEFDYTLSCADFKGIITWKRMVNDILAKFNNNYGLSYTDFVENYYGVSNSNLGNVVFNNDSNPDESSTFITWTVTTAQLGKVMDSNGNQTVTQKTISVKFQSKDEYIYPSYYVTFKMNINLPTMPMIYGYRSALWSVDGVLAKVYPVQYKLEFAQTPQTETCSYNYDFDQLFVNGQIVKNLLPCGQWNLQWTNSAVVANAVELINFDMNQWYGVQTPTTNGATNISVALNDIYVYIYNNDAGKAILGKDAGIDVWAQINPYNLYKVSSFDLHFVEPLKINTTLVDDHFVDQVIEGSKVDCSDTFSITDFFDYLVAEEIPANAGEKEKYATDLWKYYDVTNIYWDLANAVINIKRDAYGNWVVDDTLTAETAKMKATDYFGMDCLTKNGSELIFRNVNGVKIDEICKVYIPVTVSHKWGTISDYVAIELHPAF